MNNRTILPKWICEQCGMIFVRKRNGSKLPRFCNYACFGLWRKKNNITIGCFKKGHIPWNNGHKGTRFSPETEFKRGHVPANKCVVGTVKIRTRKRDGNQIAWVKITEPSLWQPRACFVWEEHNQRKLPKGFVLHRVDEDSLNDNIDNLVLMSRTEHMVLHRPEFEDRRRKACNVAQAVRWKEYRESQYDSYYWEM